MLFTSPHSEIHTHTIHPLIAPRCYIHQYRVIQRDCHKWKCYLITVNLVFIDFWGISRFNYYIFGWNRQFFGVPLNLKAIFKRFRQNSKLATYPYFFMWPRKLVHQNWFLCDSDDAPKFRCSRTEIWGTFPSEVPISKKASNPACQAENSPLSSWMGTFQKSRGIQRFARIWVWYVPTELGLPGPKKWRYCRRCLKEQLISGPKKDHVGKIGK